MAIGRNWFGSGMSGYSLLRGIRRHSKLRDANFCMASGFHQSARSYVVGVFLNQKSLKPSKVTALFCENTSWMDAISEGERGGSLGKFFDVGALSALLEDIFSSSLMQLALIVSLPIIIFLLPWVSACLKAQVIIPPSLFAGFRSDSLLIH